MLGNVNDVPLIIIASVPTKRSLRLQTWRKIENKRCAPNPYSIYNRVPNFNGADQAATLLSETDEYKNASECIPVFIAYSHTDSIMLLSLSLYRKHQSELGQSPGSGQS